MGYTYVMSDVHGCYEQFEKMLQLIGFGPDDKLIILGDIIDRGPQNKDMIETVMNDDRIELLIGNHENMLVASFVECFGPNAGAETIRTDNWFTNGGDVTFRELYTEENRELMWKSFQYFAKLPVYKELTVNGQDFVLVHASVGESYGPEVPLKDRSEMEMIWVRSESTMEGKVVVTGHTPTIFMNKDKTNNIYHNKDKTYYNVDGGVCFKNGQLNCLRLDDMAEFVIK